jgi:hypothetical protein
MPKAMELLDLPRYNNSCDSEILNFATNEASIIKLHGMPHRSIQIGLECLILSRSLASSKTRSC